MTSNEMLWSAVPAMGSFTVVEVPHAGDSVEVVGVTFTFGTDVVMPTIKPVTTAEVAFALASAINGYDAEYGRYHLRKKQIKVCAHVYGSVVTLIARVPGVAGNAYAYSSATTAVEAEGSTLSGGAVS